jgi:E3 ubiquitin-protein ligase HUWE1
MCDDFIKEGLPLLSQIPALPCLPVAFTTTEAHAALSRLYRVIGEHDHVRLVQHLVGGIKADFEATKPLWQPESPEWADKQEVQVLPGFSHRLTFLSDMLLALSYSHQRIAASMLKALGASTGTSFMSDLGALHRAAFRQHASYTPQPDLLNANPLDAAGLEDKPATKHSAVQFLSTRVHAMCTKLYRAIIRSLFHKRGTDAAFKKESSALGKQIALDIVKHLESVHEPRPETVAVGLTTLLLFDGESLSTERRSDVC